MEAGNRDRSVGRPGASVWIGLGIFLGVIASLILSQIGLNVYYDGRVEDYGTVLLAHASEVASQGAAAAAQINAADGVYCSPNDMVQLRRLSFRFEYLYDIGRVRDGFLLCTASWGQFPVPKKLPPPQHVTPNGFALWGHVHSVVDSELVLDIASRGSIAVFTAPSAYNALTEPKPGYGALVLTRDGDHVFERLGEAGWLPTGTGADGSLSRPPHGRIWSGCSERWDICVVEGYQEADLLKQPVILILVVAGIGAVTGGSLAFGVRRRASPSLPEQIRRALASGGLQLVYQPLVRIRDGSMVGLEALARLTDRQGRSISPEVFIRIAENSGLMPEITRRVVDLTLSELAPFLRTNSNLYVSINVTVDDALDQRLYDQLNRLTRTLGVSRSQIVLELTERLTASPDRLIEGLMSFRRAGYKFFLDDFGTGYSSLAYLSRLPVDGIKIDKTFTDSLLSDPISEEVVRDVCGIADKAGLNLVAEGVETVEQAERLMLFRSDIIGQGWLFSKAVNADQLPHFFG